MAVLRRVSLVYVIASSAGYINIISMKKRVFLDELCLGWMNHYPQENSINFSGTYLLESDFSSG